MIFSLVINGAPISSEAPYSALRFAEALLADGHSIYRVFFHGDGVLNATNLNVPPQDDLNIQERWQTFAEQHGLDVVVCVASALKRGIIDEGEASRYEKEHHNLRAGMALSGLGQLIDANCHSDRVVTFGA